MGPANAGVAKRLVYGRGEMTGLTPALSRATPPSQIKSGGPQGAGEDTGWGGCSGGCVCPEQWEETECRRIYTCSVFC